MEQQNGKKTYEEKYEAVKHVVSQTAFFGMNLVLHLKI